MDTMDKTQRLNRTIPCTNCGELFSISYKRCPFCGGKERQRPAPDAAPAATTEPKSAPPPAPKPEPKPDPKADLLLVPEIRPPAKAAPPEKPAREPREAREPRQRPVREPRQRPTPRPQAAPTPRPQPAPAPRDLPAYDDVTDYGSDIDWTPELELDGAPIPITSHGGKRLQKTGGFPLGRALLILLSLALIAAAAYIVWTRVVPLVQTRFFSNTGVSQDADADKDANAPVDPAVDPTTDPDPASLPFRLMDTKFTLSQKSETKQLEAIYTGEGEMGPLVWNSSDSNVVSVSDKGVLTAVAPGTASVSALRQDGSKAICTVTCLWDANTPVTTLSLSISDFTIGAGEPSVTIKVIGTSSKGVWAVADPNVVSVDGNGVVKHVGKGKTKVTVTVDGQVLTCVVYGK